MENQRAHTLVPAPLPLTESKQRGYSQRDVETARAIVESFVRNVHTVEETQHVADHIFVSGLVTCSRGNLEAGGKQLSRAIVGIALCAWQLERLSVAAMTNRDFPEAALRRAAAERELGFIPGRLQLASSTLRGTAEGDQALTELKGIVNAFLGGSDLVSRLLSETAAIAWHREFSIAGSAIKPATGGAKTTELGVPDLTQGSRVASSNRLHHRSGCPGLSAREREVLAQIVAGQTTAEIAYRLGVKTTTVATLVGRIFNKLGVNNRPSAVAAALRFGLCTGDD